MDLTMNETIMLYVTGKIKKSNEKKKWVKYSMLNV